MNYKTEHDKSFFTPVITLNKYRLSISVCMIFYSKCFSIFYLSFIVLNAFHRKLTSLTHPCLDFTSHLLRSFRFHLHLLQLAMHLKLTHALPFWTDPGFFILQSILITLYRESGCIWCKYVQLSVVYHYCIWKLHNVHVSCMFRKKWPTLQRVNLKGTELYTQ